MLLFSHEVARLKDGWICTCPLVRNKSYFTEDKKILSLLKSSYIDDLKFQKRCNQKVPRVPPLIVCALQLSAGMQAQIRVFVISTLVLRMACLSRERVNTVASIFFVRQFWFCILSFRWYCEIYRGEKDVNGFVVNGIDNKFIFFL